MAQFDENTTTTIGFVAGIGAFLWGGAKWFFKIRRDVDKNKDVLRSVSSSINKLTELKVDVDRHTEQLNHLEKTMTGLITSNGELRKEIREQSEKMARVEAKLDLLLGGKIK